MRHKWLLAACAAVILLATACSSNGISSAQGKERANATRKSTAAVYWKLYNAISAPVFRSGGTGSFAKCDSNGPTSITTYTVRATLGVDSGKMTLESLTQLVASQLAGVGWHLSPADDPDRSAKKGGITVKLQLPEVTGPDPLTVLQVQGECVDLGSASNAVVDGYYPQSDQYHDADASKSPVPTTFPSPIG
jgi:hypothetical protein